jgi:MFS transporter, DHA1 family, multidrug resistance protein
VTRPPFLLLTVVLGAVATLAPLGIDGFLPATRSAAAALGTDATGIQVALGAFTIGLAFGQTVLGPLSDRIGRRRAMLMGLGLMVAATLGAAAAPSLDALVAWRVLQGFAAATGMTLARAIVRDLYAREEAARVMSYMTVVSGLGPILFPIAGGQLAVAFGWRAVLIFAAAYVTASGLAFAFVVPETNVRRDSAAMAPTRILLAWRSAFADATFRHYLACNCVATVGLFAFLAASPKVVMAGMGVGPDRYGLYFAATTFCFGSGAFTGGRLAGRLRIDAIITRGASLAAIGGVAMAALAVAGIETVPAVMAPVALFLFGFGIMVPSATAGALTPFPHIAGAASSAMGLAQQCAAAATTFVIATFGATQTSMAAGVAASGACMVALALRPKRVM